MEMKIGTHMETIRFIVALNMAIALILGFTWLEKWNPAVWVRKCLRFPQPHPGPKAAVEVELCKYAPPHSTKGRIRVNYHAQ